MGDRVILNVGGQIFHTTKSTLRADPRSMLAKMFEENQALASSVRDENGAWFIDRDPIYFRVILNFLRSPTQLVIDPNVNPNGVLEEAHFFQVHPLIAQLTKEHPDITRTDVIKNRKNMSFVGIRLTGVDLSRFNLTDENFENTIISHTNFKWCTLDGAIFWNVKGRGTCFKHIKATEAKFASSKLPDCSFEKADLKHCNFNDSHLNNAFFLNASCTGALFQKTRLDGANFEGCDLLNAKFHHATLRGANFTNANLTNCHFTYADLRGAKINWKPEFKIHAKEAKITQAEYNAIPLADATKQSLELIIVEPIEPNSVQLL